MKKHPIPDTTQATGWLPKTKLLRGGALLLGLCACLLAPALANAQGSPAAQAAHDPGKTRMVASSDGLQLSVHEWGNLAGPELLFIHGFAQSYLSFSKQYSGKLARDFRIVAFDLRGHGESEKPMTPVSYTDGRRWADDVAAVIRATDLKHPLLIGWSLGGRVVSQYLDVYGDQALGGIAFVDSRTIVNPEKNFLGPGANTLAAMSAQDADENIRATTAFLRACFATPPSDADFRYMLAYNMMTPTFARKATQQWPGKFDDALRKVKVPVLVMHGSEDQIVLRDAAEYTAQAIPQAKVVIIKGAGHSPFWEKSEEFNHEIDAFARTLKQ